MKLNSVRNIALSLAARDGLNLVSAPSDWEQTIIDAVLLPSQSNIETLLLVGCRTQGVFDALKQCCANDEVRMFLFASEGDESAGQTSAGIEVIDGALGWSLAVPRKLSSELVIANQPTSYADILFIAEQVAREATRDPIVPNETIDLAVVDTKLNELDAEKSAALIAEIFRVLRKGGTAKFIVKVADEPQKRGDSELPSHEWCARWLPLELEIFASLDQAGFHGMRYASFSERPTYTMGGAEIRTVVIEAYKGKQGACFDQGHAVVYRGPWREVADDDGHVYKRGERTAVCEKTFRLLRSKPYKDAFIAIEPYLPVPLGIAPFFDCNTPSLRNPAVTKGRIPLTSSIIQSAAADQACCSDGDCC